MIKGAVAGVFEGLFKGIGEIANDAKRKKMEAYGRQLEHGYEQQKKAKEMVLKGNRKLEIENAKLKNENESLKREIDKLTKKKGAKKK